MALAAQATDLVREPLTGLAGQGVLGILLSLALIALGFAFGFHIPRLHRLHTAQLLACEARCREEAAEREEAIAEERKAHAATIERINEARIGEMMRIAKLFEDMGAVARALDRQLGSSPGPPPMRGGG